MVRNETTYRLEQVSANKRFRLFTGRAHNDWRCTPDEHFSQVTGLNAITNPMAADNRERPALRDRVRSIKAGSRLDSGSTRSPIYTRKFPSHMGQPPPINRRSGAHCGRAKSTQARLFYNTNFI